MHFRQKKFDRSISDCQKALELNPYHFGARPVWVNATCRCEHRAALKAFRALRLNPNMDGVAETIRALENALGEEGRRDDKK